MTDQNIKTGFNKNIDEKFTSEDVKARVKKIIAEKLTSDKADAIALDSNLKDDLGADSLDAVEIVMGIEEEFDMEIPDQEAEGLHTVQQIINYILDKKNNS